MKLWSSAALPLTLLLALAVLSFWLRYATELPDERNDGKSRHDPDFIVNTATAHKLDKSGKLLYTLVADEIRHYPDDDTTDLTNPKLEYFDPTKPTVTTSAVRGQVSPGGERVELSERVEVRRAATDRQAELVLETPDLTVLTDEEKAFTKSRVVITQGKSWVQGVGMQIDNKLQTYLLESQVTGEIASHPAKTKP